MKESVNVDSDIGVIFPSVFDTKEKRDMNPFLSSRPTREFFDLRIRVFSRKVSFVLWNLASKLKRKLKRSNSNMGSISYDQLDIYAGHGSLFIFCKSYFESGGTFRRDTFMYAEEIFVAESCLARSIRCRLDRRLRAKHISHATTALVPSERRRVWALESLCSIRSTYF